MVGTSMPEEKPAPADLQVSMIVFSDPHYYDPSLGIEGEAFEDYLNNDRKLLRESPELLNEVIDATLEANVEFVLVPGDLTKDGSKLSHLGFAQHMTELEERGVKVFVVPGNHDVSNGEARAFSGDTTIRVENVNPQQFSEIYSAFGYDEAVYRDTNSLSYISEPTEGLWIVGLDACLYAYNDSMGHSHTAGAFNEATLKWLEEILLTEEADQKVKVALMHHGVLEHYKGQKKYFGEYIVSENKKVSRQLADLGINTVFTGHYHANDITYKQWNNGSFLFDIETGSLVTYPCPYRRIELSGDSLSIETRYIQSIPSVQDNFQSYAKEYVVEGVSGIAEQTLIEMNLRPEDAHRLAYQIGDAISDHYSGDEIPRDPPINMEGVNLKGRLIISFRKKLVKGLSNDLSPADNHLNINLQTGEHY